MSQAELAERVGTKQPAIARIERGGSNIGLSTLRRIAEALDAAVRLDISPWEIVKNEYKPWKWWERARIRDHVEPLREVTLVEQHFHFTLNHLSVGENAVPRKVERLPHQTIAFVGRAVSQLNATYNDASE